MRDVDEEIVTAQLDLVAAKELAREAAAAGDDPGDAVAEARAVVLALTSVRDAAEAARRAAAGGPGPHPARVQI